MSTVFGDVADLYDEQRPGYPPEITEVVLGYAGRPPATMAEVLIGRRSVHEDAGLGAAIRATYARYPPDAGERPPLPSWAVPSWAVPEIRDHTGLTDVTTWETAYATSTTAEDVLLSVRTLGPFLRRSPSAQRALLDDLRQTLEAYGAPIRTRVETTVVMARA